jgi:hypothetical protein
MLFLLCDISESYGEREYRPSGEGRRRVCRRVYIHNTTINEIKIYQI